MTAHDSLLHLLTPEAQRVVALVTRQPPTPGVHRWLAALAESGGPAAAALAPAETRGALLRRLRERLASGDVGDPLDPAAAIASAYQRALARGGSQAATADLAAVVLSAAGHRLARELRPMEPPLALVRREPTPTPALDRLGRDLTREAAAGRLGPVVGRDDEVQLLVETLCRRSRRCPALVGPAGVGKTAVVEGLARRIASGDVPAALRGARLVHLRPPVAGAGASPRGGADGERSAGDGPPPGDELAAVLAEASQAEILLFVDDARAIAGPASPLRSTDVAGLLGSALLQSGVACIVAATEPEYRRCIESDPALARRFLPLRIAELGAEATLDVLLALRQPLATARGVEVGDDVLSRVVALAQRSLRNRCFPDKAIDLLEQCVAGALAQGKASVEVADAEAVVRRMVGMPLGLPRWSGDAEALWTSLADRTPLAEEDVTTLVGRLAVTMRGFDLRPARPNAVLLLLGEAAPHGESVAAGISEALFETPDRVIVVDFGRLLHPDDLLTLLDLGPDTAGHAEHQPIRRLAQTPWCVLHCEGVDACHPQVLAVLAQALADGFLGDVHGRHVYLSDAVVVLTAAVAVAAQDRGPIGFPLPETPRELDVREAAAAALGAPLVDQVDLVCADVLGSAAARRDWVRRRVLADLTARCREAGLRVEWDESLVEWLAAQQESADSPRAWERLVDRELGPLLIAHLPSGAGPTAALRVRYDGDRILVEPGEDG